MSAREIPGDPDGKWIVATDGIQFAVLDGYSSAERIPLWATLWWILKDDPRHRPDWNRLRGYKAEKFEKLSKSDA